MQLSRLVSNLVGEQPKSATYTSKHEQHRPHHFGDAINHTAGFVAGFVIDFWLYCWNEADEKTDEHRNTTL